MARASYEEVRDFIVRQVGATDLAPNGVDGIHLLSAGIIDSVGFLGLIVAIETEFGIEVDVGEGDPEEFLTVGGLARCATGLANDG